MTIHVYATSIHVFAASHSNYSAQPLMTIVLLPDGSKRKRWLPGSYLHLSAASPHSSVAIGGNGVCVFIFASVYCTGQAAHSLSHGGIEYRSHKGEFSVMSRES